MEDTLAMIREGAGHAIPEINVSVTSSGDIVGQGVSATPKAIQLCGGKLDDILRSFGGIEGGAAGSNPTIKAGMILGKLREMFSSTHKQAASICALRKLAEELTTSESPEVQALARELLSKLPVNGGLSDSIAQIAGGIDRAAQAVASLGGQDELAAHAASTSLAHTSVTQAYNGAGMVGGAVECIHNNAPQLREIAAKFNKLGDTHEKLHEAASMIKKLVGGDISGGEVEDVDGGETEGGLTLSSKTNNLSDRLYKTRQELKALVNKFIGEFGSQINGMATSADNMSKDFGKRIDYDEATMKFLESFKSLNEFLSNEIRLPKLYQYLLELNQDYEVDAKETKDRFLSLMRVLAESSTAMDKVSSTREFAAHCKHIIDIVNKYNDAVKVFREEVKGGSSETMNELFSVDSSKINISGLLNPLDSLKLAVKKIEFYRNIAVFRSNLEQTNKEIQTYSKDYTKSVGKAIGEAITRIQVEYNQIIAQVSDNKTGMGLEIDMYNESAPAGQKISKEKLKHLYKWKCDSRIGLYKVIEAIDLYLLHFTETVTKNPDAVADLHKLLSATKVIAKWYDTKAGDNLVRVFESFNTLNDEDLDTRAIYTNPPPRQGQPLLPQYDLADLSRMVGNDRAPAIYDRCRRAVEGVVVLKNIISYFITISEKYGNLKDEKHIFMAPSNIYKNLVNYIWVSAIDMNMASVESMNENNELKRSLTFQDTQVKLAKINQFDPTMFGINFNQHSMDKLKILKSLNDVQQLGRNGSVLNEYELAHYKQVINGIFARLGKTRYIQFMLYFGVFNFSGLDRSQIRSLLGGMYDMGIDAANKFSIALPQVQNAQDIPDPAGEVQKDDPRDVILNNLADQIAGLDKTSRDQIQLRWPGENPQDLSAFVSLATLTSSALGMRQFLGLNVFRGGFANGAEYQANPVDVNGVPVNGLEATLFGNVGFMNGFMAMVRGNALEATRVSSSQRALLGLNYVVSAMLTTYRRTAEPSQFAIDDNYFVLTIKAIAGKIMAVMGINSILKRPDANRNSFMTNPTRLIMGGSDEPTVINEAVELYVRLPLLVEFYRRIFDDGNKDYKQGTVRDKLDDEQISLVPDVGGIWSGLIMNVFDKSKHIDNGIYTAENIRKLVGEINSIYKHYKGSVPDNELVRHIVLQLVAEINRRYGIIKRQELQQYYQMMNATKNSSFTTNEVMYSNNDLDILNEAIEFQDSSPSDAFIKMKESVMKSTDMTKDEKVAKLTDFAILKTFREKIAKEFRDGAPQVLAQNNATTLTIVDRIRSLKKAIAVKTSNDDKYDMIVKAIEEADAMNQSSNDIYLAFHEFVIVPLQTVKQMHKALRVFLLTLFDFVRVAADDNNGIVSIQNDPILSQSVQYLNARNDDTLKRMLGRVLGDQNVRNEFTARDRNISFPLLFGNRFLGYYDNNNLTDGNTNATEGSLQLAIVQLLTQFSTATSGLVKLNISASTSRITVDLSEYKNVCEHLIANVKFMVDKFTGLVPTALIERVLKPTGQNEVGVLQLEKELLHLTFNKANRAEREQDIISIDTLNRLMPIVSKIIYATPIRSVDLLKKFMMVPIRENINYGNGAINETMPVLSTNALPIIRDAFTVYITTSKVFSADDTINSRISRLLFDASTNAKISDRNLKSGVLQTFNTLIAQYLNDLYDSQSRKIYTKAFATFAGNALVDALNGQSFPDFGPQVENNVAVAHYELPKNQAVLSSTIAYVLKVMTNRVHPVSGMKLHEIGTLQEVSAHMMEKYRAVIPMYLRLFKSFVARCKMYRKILGKLTVNNGNDRVRFITADAYTSSVRETQTDVAYAFATQIAEMIGTSNVARDAANAVIDVNAENVRDTAMLYLDEIVNAMTAIISDAEAVQSELLESDPVVSLYFDIKRDFTKNYYSMNKEFPFAPLSIMTMGFAHQDAAQQTTPLRSANINDNKFLYGLRCMLVDDFKISSKKVPYLKKLIMEFNGYTTKSNNIDEAKFNSVLQYVGVATSFIYDLRFFNGMGISRNDLLANSRPANDDLATYQQLNTKDKSITVIESVNAIDSRNRIATWVKTNVARVQDPADARGADYAGRNNPRAKVMMVNILDLNIIPINVHALMREMPLANIYNYAMTFDEIITELTQDPNAAQNPPAFRPLNAAAGALLKNPYATMVLANANANANIDPNDNLIIGEGRYGGVVNAPFNNFLVQSKNTRFIYDILLKKVLRAGPEPAAGQPYQFNCTTEQANQRFSTKIYRNLLFLTLVQDAIKKKVKNELEFINTRLVSQTNAVSNVITDLSTEDGRQVDDNMFEF